jgi:hypothetical protein
VQYRHPICERQQSFLSRIAAETLERPRFFAIAWLLMAQHLPNFFRNDFQILSVTASSVVGSSHVRGPSKNAVTPGGTFAHVLPGFLF